MLHLKAGVFLIHAPRQRKIYPVKFERYNTEVAVILPKNSCEYLFSKFKTYEIEQVCGNIQQNCIGILNRSLIQSIVIKKTDHLVFLF